jgi:2,3-bisphosphoglycerate-independent phosphoglycerate mutase
MRRNVGLPEGQMGNSEVGHLNIGAGRIVYQDWFESTKLYRITLAQMPVLVNALQLPGKTSRRVILSKVSDGGVHSLDKNLYSYAYYQDTL